MAKLLLKHSRWWLPVLLAVAVVSYAWVFDAHPVDYNTQVRPILNKKCITCHGGVRRKGGFSLLFRDDAVAATESGKPAIVPGDPNHSEFMRRLKTHSLEDRMPYHDKPLSEEEIDLLGKWISEGANYGIHWAYAPVQETKPPKPRGALFGLLPTEKPSWVRNDVDYFILDKLKTEGLTPSKEADKRIMLRRVSMDLTGLPAPVSIAHRFLNDNSDKAYETLVDSLLAQPSYGERWTAMWMDLARYGDTKGYEADNGRNIWRYRDWLITAFNQDKPYDVFLTEQIAGDLLPEPTNDQLIATAFHRNALTNDEGGTDNEEFRTSAVLDRVNTTWESLMGTTFACTQCHGHPYDPFKQEDYYRFVAFFNNTRDEDTYADYPLLREYHGADSAEVIALNAWMKAHGSNKVASEYAHFLRTGQPAINSLVADHFSNAEIVSSWYLVMRQKSSARIPNANLEGSDHLLFIYQSGPKGTVTVHTDSVDGPVLFKMVLPGTKYQWRIMETDIPTLHGNHDLHFQYESAELQNLNDNGAVFERFWFTHKFPGTPGAERDSAHARFLRLMQTENVTTTPVMEDNPAGLFRPTHVFERGNWLVKGKQVTPGTPHSLNAFPAGASSNRLGLAQWMTSKENPLVSRALVNRLWAQLFGTGIAETLEDLGTQGIPPTHRELLDYLSWRFMHDMHWSIKALLKEMVMSATYRQDSKQTPEGQQKDPYNRFYARGPRQRFDAEQLRDQALAVSGLLSQKMFGPSVMPWQPPNIWGSPWNGARWDNDSTENGYRRALYTYWKRSSPYPAMTTFDASSREVCLARRICTNTPLQALNLLNDSTMLMTARKLAQQMAAGSSVRTGIGQVYERMMGRPCDGQRLEVLETLYRKALSTYAKDGKASRAMAGPGKAEPAYAARVVVANAMLNLDEFITKN
jgi:hypothetical protein